MGLVGRGRRSSPRKPARLSRPRVPPQSTTAVERSRYLDERGELKGKLQASDEANAAKLKAQYAKGVVLQNHDLEKVALEKQILSAVKEAQHSRNELDKVRADASSISTELENLRLRFHDLEGANVYSVKMQQAEDNLVTKLQKARDVLAEMTSSLDEAKRYLKEAKARSGDETEQLEARIEKLEGENVVLVKRSEASEKATKAALSSVSAHTDVWGQSPATKEASCRRNTLRMPTSARWLARRLSVRRKKNRRKSRTIPLSTSDSPRTALPISTRRVASSTRNSTYLIF